MLPQYYWDEKGKGIPGYKNITFTKAWIVGLVKEAV